MNLPAADSSLLESLLPAPLSRALRQPDPTPETILAACKRLEAVLSALEPFVPSPVLDIHSGRLGTSRINGAYFTGTTVFAAVSGFATLSSELAKTGRSGNEELSTIVNRLFATLSEELYLRGGVLIKFGGETFTAFFDAGRLGLDHTALACAAALALEQRMAEFTAITTSVGTFQLRLRIAVHTGRMFAAEVGDDDHAELIVTGRATNRVVSALEAATPGDVVISDETLRAIGAAQVQRRLATVYVLHSLDAEPRRPPVFAPTWQIGQPSLETMRTLLQHIRLLRRYLPHGLLDRFAQARAIGGDFRPVTVLFANFYTFSKLMALLELPALVEHDMTVVGDVLNLHYTHTQAIIRRYGGSINKVDMATFGDRLMALFGAPIAHEDDAARAVRAAVDMRATLRSTNQAIFAVLREWTQAHPDQRALLQVAAMPLRQRIGIASGTVFAGIVGTPRRHDYTVIGAAVGLAEGLLTVANDSDILLSATTYQAVRQLYPAEPLPARMLEGLEGPAQAFRVRLDRTLVAQSEGARAQSTPLIGRQDEFRRLFELAEGALTAGQSIGQLGVVVGEAGVGKSRLVEETLRELRSAIPEVAVIRAVCQSYEQTNPYATISRLLRQALDLASADAADQALLVQQQLDELVPDWSRFAPLLGPLLNLSLPESDLTQALTLEQRHGRLHDLIVGIFFAHAQRRPLVLIVDDLQWADASSRALIRLIADGLVHQPLVLLLAYRPAPDLAEPWRDLAHATTITLGDLAPAESETLLTTLLDGQLPDALRPLVERAHGNPLFLEEIVRYLLGSGALRRDQLGAWVGTRPIDPSTVPAQLEQLIIARLDRLDDGARGLLEIAAVIGQRFAEELLAIMSARATSLTHYLEALVDAELLLTDESAPEPAYRFKHALIRDVTYSRMLFARRRELHEQIAAAIEHVYSADLDQHRVVLAQHYLRAGHPEEAFPQLIQAAQYAQARYANSEALDLYRQALTVAPWRDQLDDEPDYRSAATLYQNLGDVLALIGDYGEARTNYETLMRLLAREPSADRAVYQAALQRKIATTYEHQGNLDRALIWLIRATDSARLAAPADAAVLEQARLLSDTGWLHFRRGELDQAQQYLEQALEQIDTLAAYDEQARIHNRLGGIAWTRGDLALAQHYVERRLAASVRSGNLEGQASALNNLGLITESQGNIEDAIRYGRQAMEINERIGNRRELAIAAMTTGYALYDMESYQPAHEYLAQALKLASEVRDTYLQMMALLNLGRVLAGLEQWDAAERAIRQSQFIAVQLDLPGVQVDGHVALAEVALRRNAIDAAIDEYQLALALVADAESEEGARFQRLEAKIVFVQGDQGRAVQLLDANENLFMRLHNHPEAERTRKLRGGMLANVETLAYLRYTGA